VGAVRSHAGSARGRSALVARQGGDGRGSAL